MTLCFIYLFVYNKPPKSKAYKTATPYLFINRWQLVLSLAWYWSGLVAWDLSVWLQSSIALMVAVCLHSHVWELRSDG